VAPFSMWGKRPGQTKNRRKRLQRRLIAEAEREKSGRRANVKVRPEHCKAANSTDKNMLNAKSKPVGESVYLL